MGRKGGREKEKRVLASRTGATLLVDARYSNCAVTTARMEGVLRLLTELA
jgi:hypothetical protein